MQHANLEQDREFRKLKSLLFLYEVSQDGRIRNARSKRFLKCHKNNQGYYLTTVSIKGRARHITVHSLVAEAWLGEKPAGYEIDHIDKDKTNNHYTNLRYVTHSENNLHRVMNWKHPVKIVGLGEDITFETTKSCAEYISKKYNKPYGTVRAKLSKHRHHIYKYDIIYLSCAETGHSNHDRGKEQST